MENLDEILARFRAISLAEMDAVRLMNRTDRKYCFKSHLLGEVLAAVVDDYYILEIEGQRNLPYATTYYDTANDDMFLSHHRGKMNRYKIRRRCYVATDSSFLEIKFKNNKGRTIKTRCHSSYNNATFSAGDKEFLALHSPYCGSELREVLENRFRRLMLVSKAMNERCTLDIGLSFSDNKHHSSQLNELVVLEVKTDGRSSSAIVAALRRLRIKSSGFSKYCIGRSLLNLELKQNLFKPKLRQLNILTKI